MKIYKFLFLIPLLLNLNYLKSIISQTHRENIYSKNNEYIYRWWDIVEIRKNSEQCLSDDFNGTKFLKITCRDYEIGKWIKSHIGQNNIDILSVVPAQTLYYRLKGLKHNKTKYLTVTWNDFSNRKKAFERFNYLIESIQKDCSGDKRVVFILFPTSETTINTSKSLFTSETEQIFSQEIIEDELINIQNKCIKREYMKLDNEKNIVYWIEFYIPNNEE